MKFKDIFIGRDAELKSIKNDLMHQKNCVLISPIQYGKTHIINKIKNCSKINDYIYIDIFKYSYSLIELSKYILNECFKISRIECSLETLLNNQDLDSKIKIKKFSLTSVIQCIENNDDKNSFIEVLEFIENISKQINKNIIVIFDEVSELYTEDLINIKIMRSVIQHHKYTTYLFTGSNLKKMTNMFIDIKGPFYRSANIYKLKQLEYVDFFNYFKRYISNVDSEIIETIFNLFECHPYYTTNIFHKISILNSKKIKSRIELSDLSDMINDMLTVEDPYMQSLYKQANLIKDGINVLKIMINNKNVIEFNKQRKYSIIQKLINEGIVFKHDGKYKIVNPLFKLYLSNY